MPVVLYISNDNTGKNVHTCRPINYVNYIPIINFRLSMV